MGGPGEKGSSGPENRIVTVTKLIERLVGTVSKNLEVRDHVTAVAGNITEEEDDLWQLVGEYCPEYLDKRGGKENEQENGTNGSKNWVNGTKGSEGESYKSSNGSAGARGTSLSNGSSAMNGGLKNESLERTKESVHLRTELQRLEEIETRIESVLSLYVSSITRFHRELECHIQDHGAAKEHLIRTYEARLSEEKRMYSEYKAGNEQLASDLTGISETLKNAGDQLAYDAQTVKVQQDGS